MNEHEKPAIARPVEILKGTRAIANFLQISLSEVQDLIRQGAPLHLRQGTWRAEKAELWEWWKRTME